MPSAYVGPVALGSVIVVKVIKLACTGAGCAMFKHKVTAVNQRPKTANPDPRTQGFRVLRRATHAIRPRPVAKSGSVGGVGTAASKATAGRVSNSLPASSW